MTSLRRPGREYTPTHGELYQGNGKTRSCGKCGKHKPIIEGHWKMVRPYGQVCKQCRGEK